MKTTSSIPAVLLAMALPALAQSSQTQAPASSDPATILRADPYLRVPEAVPAQPDTSKMRIGSSDYTVSGPLVQGLNRQPYGERQGMLKRIVMLPVNLLTPLPATLPPEKTDAYFQWRHNSTQPWSNVAAGARTTTADPALTDEPVGLVSVSW